MLYHITLYSITHYSLTSHTTHPYMTRWGGGTAPRTPPTGLGGEYTAHTTQPPRGDGLGITIHTPPTPHRRRWAAHRTTSQYIRLRYLLLDCVSLYYITLQVITLHRTMHHVRSCLHLHYIAALHHIISHYV